MKLPQASNFRAHSSKFIFRDPTVPEDHPVSSLSAYFLDHSRLLGGAGGEAALGGRVLEGSPQSGPMLVKEWLGAIGPFPAVPTLLSQSVSLLSPSPTAGPMSTLLLAGHPPTLWEAPP